MSNMSLTQALKEHKERKKKDSNAIMTMVIKQSKPSPKTHQTRLGTEELFIAIDPDTKQLLYYEDKADTLKGTISLDKGLLIDNSSVSLHNDKQVPAFFCSLPKNINRLIPPRTKRKKKNETKERCFLPNILGKEKVFCSIFSKLWLLISLSSTN